MLQSNFADILIPQFLPAAYTYIIPLHFQGSLQIGTRVIVQLGSKKVLTGVVCKIHNTPPLFETKEIIDILEEKPSFNQLQLNLIDWISTYYLCTKGEVLQAAMPSGLKINSESRVQINPQYQYDTESPLSSKEELLMATLRGVESILFSEIGKNLGIKGVYTIIKSLLKKEAIFVFELVREKFSPITQKRIRLHAIYVDNQTLLQNTLSALEKKPKQADILLSYLQKIPVYKDAYLNENGILKKEFLTENLSESSLSTLVKGGIFEEFEVTVSRFDLIDTKEISDKLPTFSPAQKKANTEIHIFFKEKNTVLLHGITGSGKTEIYIDLIQKTVESGSQVLYLLPEIALTTQIVARLKKIFGKRLGIYHSKFSANERVETWKGLQDGRFDIIIGVRSSVFLPFEHLGLIIIDEEHEPSYKQHDPAPRYHAREVALMLAQMHKAKVLLGSATPSVETYYLAKNGKYGLVELFERFGEAQLPDVEFAELSKNRIAKENNAYTPRLLELLALNKTKKKQSILFQNRRGYAPYMNCDTCGWIASCPSCDVTLTYHQYKKEMRCHYCGFHTPTPKVCPACQSPQLSTLGLGTEKIEEDLQLLLPDSRFSRMDLETTRSKDGHQKILDSFANGEADILIGTQMVSKGLDFDNVSLVGIIDADSLLNFPDFRSQERTFQLLTQVSGRAGRRGEKGKVVIQTRNPYHALMPLIAAADYKTFYKNEINERERFNYPPFTRLIKITIRAVDRNLGAQFGTELASQLKAGLGKERILGPESPYIERIRNMYLQEIMLKLERDKIDPIKVKTFIKELILNLTILPKYRNKLQVICDVDPI